MAATQENFQLFTSLRYDPLLRESSENSLPSLSFESPSSLYMLRYHRDRMLEAAQHFEWEEVAKRLEDGKALHGVLLQKIGDHFKETGLEDQPLKLRVLFDRSANLSVECSPVPPIPLETLYPSSFSPPKSPSSPHAASTTKPFTPSPLTGGALNLGHTDSLQSSSPPQSPTWTIRLDPISTSISPFTSLKTTHRDHYDSARTRALPKNEAAPALTEVMMHNPVKELTEGTMTSLYLFRGGRWVTPPVGVPTGEFASTARSEEGQPGKDEGELRKPFPGRWGHSVRSEKVGSGGQRGTTRRWALGKGLCMEEPVGVDTVTVGEGVWVSNGVRGFGYGKVVQ